MNRIILTAAALAFASPVLAQSQLERLLDVSPDVYSPAELAQIHLARGGDDTPPVFFDIKGALILSTHGPKAAGAALPQATSFVPVDRRN